MIDQLGSKADKTDTKGSGSADGGESRLAATAGADIDRRRVLDLVRKAAVAGPVLMTLKSTPARAVGSASNMSPKAG